MKLRWSLTVLSLSSSPALLSGFLSFSILLRSYLCNNWWFIIYIKFDVQTTSPMEDIKSNKNVKLMMGYKNHYFFYLCANYDQLLSAFASASACSSSSGPYKYSSANVYYFICFFVCFLGCPVLSSYVTTSYHILKYLMLGSCFCVGVVFWVLVRTGNRRWR